jgi:hypothetical protein
MKKYPEIPPEIQKMLHAAVDEKVEKVKELNISQPFVFFVSLCRGVHDVTTCDTCEVFKRKDGDCGFLLMAKEEHRESPVIEA